MNKGFPPLHMVIVTEMVSIIMWTLEIAAEVSEMASITPRVSLMGMTTYLVTI
jgi:hypothetical protein